MAESFSWNQPTLDAASCEKRLTDKIIEGVYGMLCLSITLPEGGRHDGILLALSKGQMRIVLEGCQDAVELREVEGQWALDDGTLVELDVLFTEGSTDVALFSDLYPRALVAGHSVEAGVIGSWSRYQPLPASVH